MSGEIRARRCRLIVALPERALKLQATVQVSLEHLLEKEREVSRQSEELHRLIDEFECPDREGGKRAIAVRAG